MIPMYNLSELNALLDYDDICVPLGEHSMLIREQASRSWDTITSNSAPPFWSEVAFDRYVWDKRTALRFGVDPVRACIAHRAVKFFMKKPTS